jgi:TIR domain-containing protein/effector-associated domain 2 (EAD2)-containing protein
MDKDARGRRIHPDHEWQERMVGALLSVNSLTDRQGRAMLEELVGDRLGHRLNLREQPTRRLQLLELVRGCAQEREGLVKLVAAVRTLEGSSPACDRMALLIAELEQPAVNASSDPDKTDGVSGPFEAGVSVAVPTASFKAPDPGGSGLDFFVSYNSADRAWASWISWELEEAGFRVLVDAWDFVPGTNWQDAMQKGVSECERTIALVSPAYLHSVYGKLEWQVAQAADPSGAARRLIPIRVAECPLPVLMSGVCSFDLFGLTQERARKRLLEQIGDARAGRRKPGVRPPFPA